MTTFRQLNATYWNHENSFWKTLIIGIFQYKRHCKREYRLYYYKEWICKFETGFHQQETPEESECAEEAADGGYEVDEGLVVYLGRSIRFAAADVEDAVDYAEEGHGVD